MKLKVSRWVLVAAAVAILLTVVSLKLDFLRNALNRSDDRALIAATQALRGAVGKRVSESRAVPPTLKDFVAGVKKASPRSRVDSSAIVTVTIEDTAKSVTTETQLCDEHKRFCFDLPGGLLHRRQSLEVATVFVRSHDGTVRVAKSGVREFSPETGKEIPTTGVDVKTNFQFVQEPSPLPAILHIRPLAGIDHRLAPGVGLEIINLERTRKPIIERLTGSVMGYWKNEDKEGRIVGQLGYRVYGNLTAGPYAGVSTNGATVVGVAATIQIGR